LSFLFSPLNENHREIRLLDWRVEEERVTKIYSPNMVIGKVD
jgi:hypothetical protein